MSEPDDRASQRQRIESGPPSSSGPASGKGERRRRRKTRSRPKEPTPAEKLKARLFPIAVVFGLALAAGISYLLVVYPNGAGPGSGKEVELDFALDEPTSTIVDKLDAGGLLASPKLFSLYVRATGMRVAAGHHLLTDDAGPQEIVRRLERLGHASKAKVVIPEGWNRFEIAKRLQSLHVSTNQGFVDASQDPALLRELALDSSSAEGFRFPATYELPRDSDPKDVVRRLKGEFDKRFAALDEHHRLGRANLETQLGWTKNEIVALASMVEKEAAVDEERPIIASVFLNRLRDPAFKRKVLQCDPTAGYGCLVLKDRVPACAGYAGKITPAVNHDPLNTYSTYVREGLPPGPIANPGTKSLTAVLAPASTKYLYFVARENRRHAFSETLEEHNIAVKDLRERSHRDQGENK